MVLTRESDQLQHLFKLIQLVMTKDLLGLVEPGFQARGVDSEEFLDEIAKRLADKLA